MPVIFWLCLVLTGSVIAAEEETTPPLRLNVTTSFAPARQTTIYNRVAVLPFLADDPQLSIDLSDAFYSALAKTEKYDLLPVAAVNRWSETNSILPPAADRRQQATALGRALKARGVIYTSLLSQRNHPLHNRGTIASLAFNIKMLDAQTGTTAWKMTVTCKGESPLNKELITKIMEESLQRLISAMVVRGDIFSTRLQKPTVISTRGELRQVRVILQPDPPHVYRTYQLLAAEEPDGVFIARSEPVINDHAPIILEDTNLKDGKNYYYTVIGLTKTGLANVPALPFAVTTSGAPTPLDTLQASGNNLRHIHLLWEPSQDPNVIGYTIYRSNSPDGPFTKTAEINDREQQNYTDYGAGDPDNYGNLADDTLYYYTIRTRNRFDIESKDTPVVSARTKGAPLPPTEIRAVEKQAKKIPLLWTAAEDPDIKGYLIFRSRSEQGSFTQIDFVQDRETQEYTDTGSRNTPLADNTTYFYRVCSLNMVDIPSEYSETVSAATKPVPVPVRGVRVSNSLFRKVELQWQADPENEIISYEVFRGETPGDLRKVATVSAPDTSYTDSGLRDGSTYWYQIRAIDRDRLKGAFFSPVSAATKSPPTRPAGLSAEHTSQGIKLEWKSNPEPDIHYYEIYSTGFMTTKVGEVPTTTFLYNEELEPGSDYVFKVRAVDMDGLTGNFSEPISIWIPLPETTEQ